LKSFFNAWRDVKKDDLSKSDLFDLYLHWGGFPGVVNALLEGKEDYCKKYLSNLYQDIIIRDFKSLYMYTDFEKSELIYNTITQNKTYEHNRNSELEKVDFARSVSDERMYCIDTGLFNIISFEMKLYNTKNMNIRQVVYWYLTKRHFLKVFENSVGLMIVNRSRFFLVVNSREDVIKGINLFKQKYDQNRAPVQPYFTLIGTYGCLFSNNIISLNVQSPLLNFWGTINNFYKNPNNRKKKSKQRTPREFNNYIGKLLNLEKEYMYKFFLVKIIVERFFCGGKDYLYIIWTLVGPIALSKLQLFGYDHSSYNPPYYF